MIGKLPSAALLRRNELEPLYRDPFTPHALDLRERFSERRLDDVGFKEFLDTLPPAATTERAKLERLFANPAATVEADLSTRAGQLVWDAGLGYVFQNAPPNAVRSSSIWRAG